MKKTFLAAMVLLFLGISFASCHDDYEEIVVSVEAPSEEIPKMLYQKDGITYIEISPDNGLTGEYYITQSDNDRQRTCVRFPLIKGGEIVFLAGNYEESIWNVAYMEKPEAFISTIQFVPGVDILVESSYAVTLQSNKFNKKFGFVLQK